MSSYFLSVNPFLSKLVLFIKFYCKTLAKYLIGIYFLHSATSRSLPLLKKLVTSLSISVCSNSSKPTESYRYTSPTVEHSLKSFSQKISNDNISHPKEPTEPQLSHSRKPSKLTFDCHSCVTKPIKTIHQYLNTNKSLTKSHVSKSRPGSIIELTPLSQLIVQSYRDIEMLRVVHAAQGSGVEGKKHSGRRELNLFRGIIPKDETGKEVDLTKVEANLKKFEELYAQVSIP